MNKTSRNQDDEKSSFTKPINSNSNINDAHHANMNSRKRYLLWCFLTIVMVILIMMIVALVAIIFGSVLDPEDQCGTKVFPHSDSQYSLFGTKTDYLKAYTATGKGFLPVFPPTSDASYNSLPNKAQLLSPHSAQSNQQPNSPLDSAPDPSSPSSQSSTSQQDQVQSPQFSELASLDKKLRNVENCILRQFHFIGRHAARYPGDDQIPKMNELLAEIQNRIDLTKFSQQNQSKHQIQTPDASITIVNNNNNNNDDNHNLNNNHKTQNKTVCVNPMAEFKQWTPKWSKIQGDLVTNSGYDQTKEIASRFKSIYPEMFNADKTEIEIGTTTKIRTVQTALPFLKLIDNYKVQDNCPLDSFPIDSSDSSKAGEITSNICYEKFWKKHQKTKLSFQETCKKIGISRTDYSIGFTNSSIIEFIASSISDKLKLTQLHERLNTTHTLAIYKTCKHEVALQGSSIWCRLLSEKDLKFLEFINDIDDYYNQALGENYLRQSSCPVTSDLVKYFQNARLAGKDQKQKAFYYFTHAEVIQRILAASIFEQIKGDTSYDIENLKSSLDRHEIPESRQWKSSLYSPFSANLAFSLYECPTNSFKVVASLNERPFRLDGCKDRICLLEDILNSVGEGLNQGQKCDMSVICKSRTIFV